MNEMLWWRILMLLSLLQGIQRTTCLNFNMQVTDYLYACLNPYFECTDYISTTIEFGSSPNCDAYRRHAYDCICCGMDTCTPKTCSCLHGAFSPETDSKLMSYKTPENASFATITIAVHEKNDFMTDPIPMSKFCADQPLSIGEQVLTLHPNRDSRKKDNDITLHVNITADVVTTTATTTETTEQIPQAVTGATNVTTIDNNGRKNTTETKIKDLKSHNGGLIGGVTVGAVVLLIAISTIVTVFLCKDNISRWNTRKRRIARKRKRSTNRIYPES